MFKNQMRKTLLYIHGLKNQTSNLQKHLYKEKIQTCAFNACGSKTFFNTSLLSFFLRGFYPNFQKTRLKGLSVFKAAK